MTDRELMQQALDALESGLTINDRDSLRWTKAIKALRARLAQQEQEPPCRTGSQCVGGKCQRCAVQEPEQEQEPVVWTERELELIDGMIEAQVIHAERCDSIPNRAMAEKQKGWDMERIELLRKIRNTAPPQREWQGLTDEEIEKLVYDIRSQTTGVVATAYVARAIEAKLKEKNT